MAEILVAASTEMAEAAAWYNDRVAGLGERFLLEAEVAFARIGRMPLRCNSSCRSSAAIRTLPDAVPDDRSGWNASASSAASPKLHTCAAHERNVAPPQKLTGKQ